VGPRNFVIPSYGRNTDREERSARSINDLRFGKSLISERKSLMKCSMALSRCERSRVNVESLNLKLQTLRGNSIERLLLPIPTRSSLFPRKILARADRVGEHHVGGAVLRAHACARECIVSTGSAYPLSKTPWSASQIDFLASNRRVVISSSPYASASVSRKLSAAIIFIRVSSHDSLIFLATWMFSASVKRESAFRKRQTC